ncbi:hypothetical protein LX32DRAFT_692836 [Colletotrichum zoysiae]|uniref:Peptidase A2 domain-containing protein n=1 Tax=Colletotrichum zoysiae TaxID=1216348 RepID=A0AAD9HJ95_9PEZI|nr:hypothetical protein LX32DRAFT_692836 [Colletotrichum zoysiae]
MHSTVVTKDPDSALMPDPGMEADFIVPDNPFAFSPGQLNKLLNPKSLSAFQALGGLYGIEKSLQTEPVKTFTMGTKPQETIPDLAYRPSDPMPPNRRKWTLHVARFGEQLRSPQLEPERSPLSRDFSGKRHYWVGGTIGGEKVQALPDTGAEYNSISPTLADRMGLKPRPGTVTQVRLPSGRLIQSPGEIQAPFKFAGERRSTLIDCLIIPGCVHDLILSHAFLRATRTLTKFVHRIKSTLCESPGRLRLNLLGGEGRRLQGFINDTSTLALPDTGSNVMLISESFAASQAMRVDRSASYCEEVEFADGSRDTTSGIVRGLKWTFGSTQQSVVCDFYVLDGLPVDVVLSGDFLFEFQVFSRYEHCMVQHDLFGDVANLYNINLIRKLFRERMEQEHQVSEHAEITEDFLKKREEDELLFRDEIRDHLNSVPNEDELLTAKRLESRRRKDWEERQQQLGQRLRVQPSSDSASSEGPSPAATQQEKAKRVSFFRRRRQSGDANIV